MDEAFEVYGSAIVAGGEAPEMLEAAKASFNLIAMFVSGFVVGDKDLAVPLGRDHRLGLHAGNQFAQVIAVIGVIGEYRGGFLSFQKTGLWRGDLDEKFPSIRMRTDRCGFHVVPALIDAGKATRRFDCRCVTFPRWT